VTSVGRSPGPAATTREFLDVARFILVSMAGGTGSLRGPGPRESALLVAPHGLSLASATVAARQALLGPMDSLAAAAPEVRVLGDEPAPDARGQVRADRVLRVKAAQR